MSFKKKNRHQVGNEQGGNHGQKNNLSGLPLAEDSDGKIRGKVDERETEGAPGRMKSENLKWNLNQIVAGCDDAHVKSDENCQSSAELNIAE